MWGWQARKQQGARAATPLSAAEIQYAPPPVRVSVLASVAQFQRAQGSFPVVFRLGLQRESVAPIQRMPEAVQAGFAQPMALLPAMERLLPAAARDYRRPASSPRVRMHRATD